MRVAAQRTQKASPIEGEAEARPCGESALHPFQVGQYQHQSSSVTLPPLSGAVIRLNTAAVIPPINRHFRSRSLPNGRPCLVCAPGRGINLRSMTAIGVSLWLCRDRPALDAAVRRKSRPKIALDKLLFISIDYERELVRDFRSGGSFVLSFGQILEKHAVWLARPHFLTVQIDIRLDGRPKNLRAIEVDSSLALGESAQCCLGLGVAGPSCASGDRHNAKNRQHHCRRFIAVLPARATARWSRDGRGENRLPHRAAKIPPTGPTEQR